MLTRRDFLIQSGLASGTLFAASAAERKPTANGPRIRWKQQSDSRFFHSVVCDGEACGPAGEAKLLDFIYRPIGGFGGGKAFHPKLSHKLLRSGSVHGEDLLEATIEIHNSGSESRQIEIGFETAARPPGATSDHRAYLPLNVAGLGNDKRFSALGMPGFLHDCDQALGNETLDCHHLEPLASHPDQLTTTAMLLVPVVDVSHPGTPWRVGLFTASDQAMRFRTSLVDGERIWKISRVVTIPAGGSHTEKCWLHIHDGDASNAWKAFHRFAHNDPHAGIAWTQDFRVHYYDYLSPAGGKDTPRGGGYDADLKHFRDFQVGLGTQHGYYPVMGEHLHPEQTEWLAMQGDSKGPVKMSFDIMRRRIKATRAAGSKAGVYMHMTILDDASKRFYQKLKSGRRIDENANPVKFPWKGPDVVGTLWWMSLASDAWRSHLLQQAEWIMEVLKPDAICMDETFSGIGYDHVSGKPEPISPKAIAFFKELHALIRSYGDDKALFSSDCSRSSFCLWADGEVGDHAYGSSLGNPLYSQEPVRYLAALGDKAWRPCAWHWHGMWKNQMALARKVGSGVGVSNGWIEYTGLARVPTQTRKQVIADIASL